MRHAAFGSIAVRQALLSTLVMIIAVAGLAIAAQVTIDRILLGGLLQTIDTDITGLTDSMVKGSVGELVPRIADRTDFASGPPTAYYRLSNSAGKRLAGNLGVLPSLDAAHSVIADVVIPHDRLLVRASRLRDGYTLIVGRSMRDVGALQQQVQPTFVLARLGFAGISLPVSLLIAGGWPDASKRSFASSTSSKTATVRPVRAALKAMTNSHSSRTTSTHISIGCSGC